MPSSAPARLKINSPSKSKFLIQNGDSVIFWGDSITDNSLWCRSIENYVRCRYPAYKVDFFNLGWAGNTSQNGKVRILRDLPPHNPTLIFIKLGMNDGKYIAFDQAICDTYIDGLKEMLTFIRKTTRARVIFISPTPYETGVATDPAGLERSKCYPQTLRRFSKVLAGFAKKEKSGFIDLNQLYQTEMERQKALDPKLKLSNDGVHPGADGNALIAALLLQAMNADGQIMELWIDLKKQKVLEAVNQKVGKLKLTEKGVSLTRQPLAFPFQFSGSEGVGIKLDDWNARLNRNVLRVDGVRAPYVLLAVNNRVLASFTREQIQKGVNLAKLGLQEESIGLFIGKIVEEKHNQRYRRWRRVLVNDSSNADIAPLNKPNFEADYLHEIANKKLEYLNSNRIKAHSYQLEIIESETGDLFAGASFPIQTPYPNLEDEVQILFQVDTNPWKKIRSTRSGKELNFTGPLRIKGDFNGWTPVPLQVDRSLGEGIWSLAINIRFSEGPVNFAFDDASPERSSADSEVMEIIKQGLYNLVTPSAIVNFSMVPDSHKIVRITKEHFAKAVRLGRITLVKS